MTEHVKPTLVLTIICIAAALILTYAHELTKDSIAEQKALKFSSSAEALFGDEELTLIDNDFGCDEIETIAVTHDGRTAMQLIVDGYEKDGINLLIGIDEKGAVSGIEFVTLNDTPGLGSKVRDIPEFRQQFLGLTEPQDGFDAISGATFSSRGMKHAVDTALKVYNENKEAILSGEK